MPFPTSDTHLVCIFDTYIYNWHSYSKEYHLQRAQEYEAICKHEHISPEGEKKFLLFSYMHLEIAAYMERNGK